VARGAGLEHGLHGELGRRSWREGTAVQSCGGGSIPRKGRSSSAQRSRSRPAGTNSSPACPSCRGGGGLTVNCCRRCCAKASTLDPVTADVKTTPAPRAIAATRIPSSAAYSSTSDRLVATGVPICRAEPRSAASALHPTTINRTPRFTSSGLPQLGNRPFRATLEERIPEGSGS